MRHVVLRFCLAPRMVLRLLLGLMIALASCETVGFAAVLRCPLKWGVALLAVRLGGPITRQRMLDQVAAIRNSMTEIDRRFLCIGHVVLSGTAYMRSVVWSVWETVWIDGSRAYAPRVLERVEAISGLLYTRATAVRNRP